MTEISKLSLNLHTLTTRYSRILTLTYKKHNHILIVQVQILQTIISDLIFAITTANDIHQTIEVFDLRFPHPKKSHREFREFQLSRSHLSQTFPSFSNSLANSSGGLVIARLFLGFTWSRVLSLGNIYIHCLTNCSLSRDSLIFPNFRYVASR